MQRREPPTVHTVFPKKLGLRHCFPKFQVSPTAFAYRLFPPAELSSALIPSLTHSRPRVCLLMRLCVLLQVS